MLRLNNRGWSVLRYGLGVLWLVAAVLQMQPGMFHPAFYGNLSDSTMPSSLQDLQDSTVAWVVPALKLTQFLYIHRPIVTNCLVILIQLVLAGLLLLPSPRKWIRVAAWSSIVWGVIVWIFGEGLSGLFSWGDMTFYGGFPGAAVIYAFAGVMLLLPSDAWTSGKATQSIRGTIATVLGLCAVLQAVPNNQQWTAAGLMSVFGNSGFQRQPSIFSAPVMSFTMWVPTHIFDTNVVLVVLLAVAAITVWYWSVVPQTFRALFFVWLFLTWWFGMDFGYIFSGLGTDLNTAPMIAILIVSVSRFKTQNQKGES